MTTKTWMAMVIGAAWAAVPGQAHAQDMQRLSGDEVAIYNLVGTVQVVRGGGSEVVVRIERGGSDGGALLVETGEIRGRQTLRVIFPSDEVVYPRMGRGSNTNMSVRDDGTFGDGGGDRGERVRIRGSGSGLEAWADVVVEVPAGQTLAAYLGVGQMEAEGVQGDLDLDVGSGGVTATDISGALAIDTGSGGIEVVGVRGFLSLDTGSGGVDVADVVGEAVSIDTGSGGVEARDVETEELSVDTGSGSVELSAIASRRVRIDTGSGSVDLELLTDVDELEVDTGSGGVTVRAPSDLGGMVEIETGSGGIDLDFSVEVDSVRRDRVRGRLGDGDGSIIIDTGSGSVRLLER